MRTAALLAGLTLLLVPNAAAARSSGTTWVLVNTTCSSPQTEVGRGCWTPGTDAAHWAVHETSATWTQSTFTAEYTYSVPGTVGPNGGAVSLGTTAQDTSNNSGLDTQICVTSTFTVKESDPCARASAKAAGQSQSGSATISLEGAAGASGATATVTVGIQDGGNVIFTYRARATSGGSGSGVGGLQVSYNVNANSSNGAHTTTVHFSGSGGFNLTHLPSANATASGFDGHGTATFEFVSPSTHYTLGLTASLSKFEKAGATTTVIVLYTVTHSTVSCAPVGSTLAITASTGDRRMGISTKVCGGLIVSVPRPDYTASIRLK